MLDLLDVPRLAPVVKESITALGHLDVALNNAI
jgi:hypothetical protein